MPTRTPRRLHAGLLGLGVAVMLVAAACAPEAPAPTTTSTSTTSTSTTTTSTTTTTVDPAPVADFTIANGPYFGAPVTFTSISTDPNGLALTYSWTLGDGTFPKPTTPSVTTAYKQAGTYSVTLSVKNSANLTSSVTKSVVQNPTTGNVFLASNPIQLPADTTADTRVWWNNQTAGKLIFANVCRKSITDPTFSVGFDCTLLSQVTSAPTATGSGWVDVPVFRGQADFGDSNWGCFAAADTAPGGVQKNTTCYIRVTNDTESNSNDAKEIAFTVTP
jgi:PKD repeat protein